MALGADRLGPIRGVARSPSGVRASLVLRRGEYEVRTINAARAYNDGLKAKTLAQALRLVEANRDAFEEAWHEHFA